MLWRKKDMFKVTTSDSKQVAAKKNIQLKNISVKDLRIIDTDTGEDISEQDDYIYLEPYSENLWRLLKLKSPELRKQETSFYYAKLQNRQNKLLFVPEISLQGGISFSGVDYPLNNPTYSAKLVFSFSNNPFPP